MKIEEEQKMDLKSLIGKEVDYAILGWDPLENGLSSYQYKATVAAVDGTMLLMTNVTFMGGTKTKDTWVNTSCLYFVYIRSF